MNDSAIRWIAIALMTAVSSGCQEHTKAHDAHATDAPDVMAESAVAGSPTPESVDASPMNTAIAGSQPKQRFPNHVPTERRILENNMVSLKRTGQILQSADFDGFIEDLSLESARDPLAQDLTQTTREYLEARLQDVGPLDAYACGLSICAGKIAIETASDAYGKFVSGFLEDGPGNYSLLDHQVTNADGGIEQRFVMSVDPGVRGVTLPLGRTP